MSSSGGPDTYDRSIRAVARGGRIAQIGVLSGFNARPDIQPLQFKNARIDGICVGSVAQLQRPNQFMAQHAIHPVNDRGFDFEDGPAAYVDTSEAYASSSLRAIELMSNSSNHLVGTPLDAAFQAEAIEA